MDQFRPSTRPRSSLVGAENILRIGRSGEQAPAISPLRESDVSRKGQAALDLVGQVADTINATESRVERLLTRALEQLRAMEERNRELEARAIQAEARAQEAEKWLVRLQVEMADKLAVVKPNRKPNGTAAA
jgi:hypothetical protein